MPGLQSKFTKEIVMINLKQELISTTKEFFICFAYQYKYGIDRYKEDMKGTNIIDKAGLTVELGLKLALLTVLGLPTLAITAATIATVDHISARKSRKSR